MWETSWCWVLKTCQSRTQTKTLLSGSCNTHGPDSSRSLSTVGQMQWNWNYRQIWCSTIQKPSADSGSSLQINCERSFLLLASKLGEIMVARLAVHMLEKWLLRICGCQVSKVATFIKSNGKAMTMMTLEPATNHSQAKQMLDDYKKQHGFGGTKVKWKRKD